MHALCADVNTCATHVLVAMHVKRMACVHAPAHLNVGEGVLQQADGALGEAVVVERLLGSHSLQAVFGLWRPETV